jgi:N-acetylglutamate synthase-like GNAT family acetyltransferase
MATCPNINLDSWKNLVAARGEDLAYYLWDRYNGKVPQEEYKSSIYFDYTEEDGETKINAYSDGMVVGGIILQKKSDGIYVRNVGVDESLRNKGIGLSLYRQAIDYANLQNLTLKPDVLSAPESLTIYKKLEKEGLFRIDKVSEQLEDGRYEIIGESVLKPSNIFFQTEEAPTSRASEKTLNKVKQVLEKMGVKTQALTDYAKAHPEIDVTSAAGVADLVRGVIAVAEGKENVALTEEMVHIATAILEQTNPKMVTEMISKIERFKIYKQVLEAYKNNKAYQLPNGKPDIRKIKKEAVDKLIAELIINQSEGSTEFPELMEEADRSLIRRWWNAITDFLRGMYKKSNISIFEETARIISQGEVEGTVSEIKEPGVFFQLTDKQTETINKIKTQQDNIEKVVEDKKESDPLLLDSEEANNFYRIKQADGTFVTSVKRVTDRVKAWYKQRFGDKTFTEAEKKFNNLKRDYGIKYHGYFEEIHARYYNEDGSKRETPGERPYISDPIDADVYNKIEKYYTELIDLLPEGTAVLSEVMIYDPKEKEAGTIDFLAIDKDGKAHILDWKFMYVADESKTDDVAWFKQGAYNIQLGRYKQMLRDAYGIKEFGMTRAVPFLMKFQRENPKDPKSPMIIKGIVAGSADKTKIENLKLMPVAEETESTGFEELDKLIRQLNAILKQYGSQKVTDETEREFKIERMNTIRRAIRIVQGSQNIAPLIEVIEVMRKDGEKILEDYNTTYKNRPATRQDSADRDLSDFSDEMRNYIQFSQLFTEIGDYIGDLIYTESMEKEAKTKAEKEYASQMKDILSKLESEQTAIRKSRKKIQEAANEFADKHIGQRNLVAGLTKPEAVVQGLSSWFRGVSELPMASLKVLYKLVTLAKGKASADALEEVKELMEIRDKIAKSGKDLRATVRQIYQSDDKGGIVNKLIYKYKKEFYDLVKEKKEEGGNKQWLLDNINVEEYKKEATAKMEENIEKIKKRRYPGTKEQEEETRAELILSEKRRWDITRKDFNGWDNYIIKRHPKDEWFSDEYKKIKADPELLELYNFITKFNQKAKEVGYIENKIASTFLPFVRKSMAESLAWDGSLSAIQNFSNNLTLKSDDVGLGKFNELTGELENSIPKYYTYDFTVKSDGVNDYSEVSEDLFKNLILYVQHVNKYKYMSEIEGQLQLVKTIEQFKGNINTNRIGEVVKQDNKLEETPNNERNAKTFDVFLRALLYEQKYALSDADTPLYFAKTLNGVKKMVNKVAGKEIWKEDENPSATSLIKTMDAANRAFQLKTLGLNPISGAVNMFGANIQISTQAGRYFKSREFLKNEKKLLGMDFVNNEERELFTQTVDLFMPLKDDPSYELFKKAGMSVLTRRSASDDLMFFMRYPEQLVEKAVFETLMENMMVENGKIVSIQEFVKNKYKGRTKDAAKYRETKDKIEKEIEELKNTRSIAKTRKLENGKLVIPGLDLKNRDELQRLTNLTRNISRNATGGIADGDINKASMSIWGRSAMVFRNWIPKLTDTRFSEFRKISDDFSVTINEDGELEGERYDIGRIRLLGHVFMNSLSQASNNFRNILEMNEAGIAEIDRMYEEYAKAYEDRTGEKMTMDRDEFAEMIKTNLRNQLKELLILGTLIGTMFALGLIAPDDDEDKATKNAFRYTQRVVDKFVGELSFFYNPANWEQVLSGSAFPAIGLIVDFSKVMSNFFMETTGLDFSDATKTPEEVRERAMPVKRVINMVPAGRSFMTWLAMIDSEFAKEFDITVQKESGLR